MDRGMRPLFALFVLTIGGGAAGCGARTDLAAEADESDAAPPECLRDEQCDDGLDCTEDRCAARTCVSTPRDDRCGDELFCTVGERCDPIMGCLSRPNPCDDGVACTEDACVEVDRRCDHAARFDLCPLSHRCDLELGCVARALVHDSEALWEVDLPSGRITRLAPTALALTDIALHPDGTAYAIDRASLFEIDQATGGTTFVARLDDENVALDVSPEGQLLTAGLTAVSRVDRRTGAIEPFAFFPDGLYASGDIAFVRARMLVTATDSPGTSAGSDDLLMEVPAAGGRLAPVGDVGFPCVWGLAPFGETLYGFTCRGLLLEIDPDTGAGRRIATLGGLRIGGAAAR